uniref:Uncharacterized protein n=1 Tax=Arundo donax TaxID=35708 RepID=A0A0A8Z2E4_ARUDO
MCKNNKGKYSFCHSFEPYSFLYHIKSMPISISAHFSVVAAVMLT